LFVIQIFSSQFEIYLSVKPLFDSQCLTGKHGNRLGLFQLIPNILVANMEEKLFFSLAVIFLYKLVWDRGSTENLTLNLGMKFFSRNSLAAGTVEILLSLNSLINLSCSMAKIVEADILETSLSLVIL
jgi:hypothetical protein